MFAGGFLLNTHALVNGDEELAHSLALASRLEMSGFAQVPALLSGKPVRAKRRDPWSSSTTSLLTTISTPPTTMKPDKILDSIQYRNGTRPQVIMWACIRDAELCCGTDCCPEDDGITVDDISAKKITTISRSNQPDERSVDGLLREGCGGVQAITIRGDQTAK
ncbi:hypothetical protein COOONC_01313 [Cooperia oncophora]